MNNSRRVHKDFIKVHPCFSEEAHTRFGRAHLPVAPACNIQCRYCITKIRLRERVPARHHEPGPDPGRGGRADQGAHRTERPAERRRHRGPRRPARERPDLRHAQADHTGSIRTLRSASRRTAFFFPTAWSNSSSSGVRSLTVTINAVTPETAEKIYAWIIYTGRRYEGKRSRPLLLAKQWQGPENAIDAGLIAKVNTVFIPGVNDPRSR